MSVLCGRCGRHLRLMDKEPTMSELSPEMKAWKEREARILNPYWEKPINHKSEFLAGYGKGQRAMLEKVRERIRNRYCSDRYAIVTDGIFDKLEAEVEP